MEVAALSLPEQTAGSDHARSGVLVLTSSIQLRYRDQQAKELCEQINRYENLKAANGVLPSSVTSLADEIRRLLRVKTESKDWEQFQIRRVVGDPDHPILLCGFGLIDPGMGQSRIVVVMQETSPAFWYKRVLDRSKERFQLTSRETDILQQLLRGCTNKEIALALGMSEQTVKEHMKHLVTKTGIASRTGIVMKAVSCGLQYETSMCPSDPAWFPCMPTQPSFNREPYNRLHEIPPQGLGQDPHRIVLRKGELHRSGVRTALGTISAISAADSGRQSREMVNSVASAENS